MLYSILKTIIETTIVQYTCQSCQGKIDENSVTVGETTDNQIHLDIYCPHCEVHAHIHAEVASVNSQIIHTKNGGSNIIPKNANAIKESDIKSMSDTISNIRSVEDLLS